MTRTPTINERFEKVLDQEDLTYDFLEIEEFFVERCKVFLSEEFDFAESAKYDRKASFLITDSSDFGACANIVDGIDTVVINRGTLTFLLWAAMAAARANSLPIEGQESRPSRARRLDGRNTSCIQSYDLPDGPVRRALGFELALLSFIFVTMHELGHLAQGHCELVQTGFYDYGAPGGGSPDTREDDGRQRAFELLADEFAVRLLLQRIEFLKRDIFPGDQPLIAPRGLTTQGKAFWFLYADPAFSVTIPYVVLSIVFNLTSSTSPRHPTAERRMLASFRFCFQMFGTARRLHPEEGRLDITRAMMSIVEEVLLGAAPPKSDGWKGIDGLPTATLEAVEAELQRFHSNRKELEAVLKPYSRTPLAFQKWSEKGSA